jgi:carbon storage regulator CsrA
LNNDITVTVTEIRGGLCKIGITAPKNVKIMREEVQRAIETESHDKDDEQALANYFRRNTKTP